MVWFLLLFNSVSVKATEVPGKADAGNVAFRKVGSTISAALPALTVFGVKVPCL